MEESFIFGTRSIIEAANAGKEIEKVLLKKDGRSDAYLELMQVLNKHKVPFQYVPIEKLNKVTRKNHQGAIAYVSPITYQDIEVVLPALFEAGRVPLVLVLDHLTDVRNFGAIARTAECVGVDAIVVPEKGGAAVNADAMKTSAGALSKIPVCRARSLMKAVTFLQESGLEVVAASEKADQAYYQRSYKQPLALVMGAEDRGVSAELLKIVDARVAIPMAGSIESLNVSVAAGVLLFECLRQRSQD